MVRVLLGVLVLWVCSGCEVSQRLRAMEASCRQMQIIASFGSLPVGVSDQLDLRLALTRDTYARLVQGSESDASAYSFEVHQLTACDY